MYNTCAVFLSPESFSQHSKSEVVFSIEHGMNLACSYLRMHSMNCDNKGRFRHCTTSRPILHCCTSIDALVLERNILSVIHNDAEQQSTVLLLQFRSLGC